jgi:hypothetical protein
MRRGRPFDGASPLGYSLGMKSENADVGANRPKPSRLKNSVRAPDPILEMANAAADALGGATDPFVRMAARQVLRRVV